MSEPIAVQELAFEARFARALKNVGLRHHEEDATEIVETVEPHDSEVEKKAAEPRAPVTINLFQHPGAHPIALDLALLRKYGPLWLTWEPETLELRVPVDFNTQSLSALNLDKLMAVAAIHLDDGFWKQWEVFHACVNPLNGTFAEFEVMQVPTYAEVLVAADIARQIRDDTPWSEEMEAYIRTVMEYDGVLVGIEPLEQIRPYASGINLGQVEEAWPLVRQTGRAPTGDTPEDEQLRRLLAVHQHLEQNRQQLRDQLPLVLHT